jgi:hypothetical protein
MSKVIWVFDIDSTLADNGHRSALLQQYCTACLFYLPSNGPLVHRSITECPNCGGTSLTKTQSSWDEFLDPIQVSLDRPIAKGVRVLNRLRELGGEIHFITGRNEPDLGEVTKQWLKDHCGWNPNKEKLIMRQEEDRGFTASVSKERSLERLKKEVDIGGGALYIFFEDDPHVFNLYNKHGIVIRCPEGWDHIMPDGAWGLEPSRAR